MAPAKPNGFQVFMFEYLAQCKKEGRHITPVVATSECNPMWQNMDAAAKNEYKIRAKKQGASLCGTVLKYTTDGRDIESVLRQERDKVEKLQELTNDIETMIKNTPLDGLADLKFCLISVSTFCITSKKKYIPAEITLMEFSLKKAAICFLHCIINPETIPTGYRGDANNASENVHRIPLPDYGAADKDFTSNFVLMDRAYQNIAEWIWEREPKMLFAWDREVETVTGVLDTLAGHCGDQNQIRVAAASTLLFYLKKYADTDLNGFVNQTSARDALNRDPHYSLEFIGCDFHRGREDFCMKVSNCTKSVVQRMMYSVCDHCCLPLDIDLVPGVHSPSDNYNAEGTDFKKVSRSRRGGRR